jgi:hypothetical protein
VNDKEHPILFSSEMVRAILEGRKTQTRRVIKPQPIWEAHDGALAFDDAINRGIKCPYGEVGSRLWVREAVITHVSIPQLVGYVADGCRVTEHWEKLRPPIHMPKVFSRITLEVTDVRVQRLQEITTEDIWNEGVYVEPPSGASVENTRFPKDFDNWKKERQKEWVDNQAKATYMAQLHHISLMHEAWEKLWDSINAAKGYGWETNPWVFVLEFRRQK